MSASREACWQRVVPPLVIAIAAVLVVGCGRSCGGSSVDAGSAGPGKAAGFEFPADHRLHDGQIAKSPRFVETFRFSGVLTRRGNDEGVGYSVELVRRWSEERKRFEYTYAVAITSPGGEQIAGGSFELLGASRLRSSRETGETIWTFTQGGMRIWQKEESDVWEVRFDNGKSGNQQLRGWIGLANKGQGYDPADRGSESGRGYVHPALETEGNLTFEGENVSVKGVSRLEHLWGEVGSAAEPNQQASSPSAVDAAR
jgi:hypothetical protein